MGKENLAKIACECLNLDCPGAGFKWHWKSMVNDLRPHPDKEAPDCTGRKIYRITRCLHFRCGSFKALAVLLEHCDHLEIKWVDSEELNVDNVE